MYSIISVDFLCDPSNGWVLDQFVALPLQTDSFLCFSPTIWIHPTTEYQRKTMITDAVCKEKQILILSGDTAVITEKLYLVP